MTLDEIAKAVEEMKAELQVMTTALSSLLTAIEEMKNGGAVASEASTPVVQEKPDPPETTIPLEQVRKVLAGKAMEGYREEVKDLITSLGAQRLSDIPSAKYKELLDKAEAIGNGSY